MEIVLTDENVIIDPDEWPVIACGSIADRHTQRYPLTGIEFCVRRHDDGRMIVYGMVNRIITISPGTTRETRCRAGVRVDDGESLIKTLRLVADTIVSDIRTAKLDIPVSCIYEAVCACLRDLSSKKEE